MGTGNTRRDGRIETGQGIKLGCACCGRPGHKLSPVTDDILCTDCYDKEQETVCRVCWGAGWDENRVDCPACGGTGTITGDRQMEQKGTG